MRVAVVVTPEQSRDDDGGGEGGVVVTPEQNRNEDGGGGDTRTK